MTHSQTSGETVAVLGAGGTMGFAMAQHGLDLPLLDLIARRLHEGAAEHGDQDFSATYLTSAPGQTA